MTEPSDEPIDATSASNRKPIDASSTGLSIATKYLVGGPGVRLAAEIRDAVLAERRRCAEIAAMWVINRNTIHPDLSLDELSENTKLVAHQTGNYISDRILGRS